MVVISSISEITSIKNITNGKYLGMQISKFRYYLYPVEKCVEHKYYPIRVTSSDEVWCAKNLKSSRILADFSSSNIFQLTNNFDKVQFFDII
ncbi:hypothetical protein SNEBB_009098 [Seison nebaliae]|nr:hypothetical protein SNEBB_009098 [Seison nebaliae]